MSQVILNYVFNNDVLISVLYFPVMPHKVNS